MRTYQVPQNISLFIDITRLLALIFLFYSLKLNIYNALIKSSLLCGSETWRLTENNKRRVEATEMDALRRSSKISRKERIRNVTIRQTNWIRRNNYNRN